VFSTFDARGQRCAIAHGDSDTSVMELEASDEGSHGRLVLEQRELHADADSGTFGEREEAAPAAAHLVCGGEPALARCAVLGFDCIGAANQPARGAEDVAVAKDGFVTVDGHRGNVDHLALLDWDRGDPRTVSTADGVAEGDDIVLLNDLFAMGYRREHAHSLFTDGIEVRKAVGVDKVLVGRLANDGPDFLTELGLDIRVLGEGPGGESKDGGLAGNAVKGNDLRWLGGDAAAVAANGDLHECDDVLVNFQDVTALAFVLTSVGLEEAGHEVLTVAFIVNLAVGNDILGELSDGVGDGTLGLNGFEREGIDPGEQPEEEGGDEGRVFAAYLILSPPALDDVVSVGRVGEGIEVVTKSDTADHVHSGAGSIFHGVELELRRAGSMQLVRNAGVESSGDVIDVGVHLADVVRRESGGDKCTHALVLPFTLDPDERAASDAEEEGTKNG
jgi:hypothetical protein